MKTFRKFRLTENIGGLPNNTFILTDGKNWFREELKRELSSGAYKSIVSVPYEPFWFNFLEEVFDSEENKKLRDVSVNEILNKVFDLISTSADIDKTKRYIYDNLVLFDYSQSTLDLIFAILKGIKEKDKKQNNLKREDKDKDYLLSYMEIWGEDEERIRKEKNKTTQVEVSEPAKKKYFKKGFNFFNNLRKKIYEIDGNRKVSVCFNESKPILTTIDSESKMMIQKEWKLLLSNYWGVNGTRMDFKTYISPCGLYRIDKNCVKEGKWLDKYQLYRFDNSGKIPPESYLKMVQEKRIGIGVAFDTLQEAVDRYNEIFNSLPYVRKEGWYRVKFKNNSLCTDWTFAYYTPAETTKNEKYKAFWSLLHDDGESFCDESIDEIDERLLNPEPNR
jgi:hypothetical protein